MNADRKKTIRVPDRVICVGSPAEASATADRPAADTSTPQRSAEGSSAQGVQDASALEDGAKSVPIPDPSNRLAGVVHRAHDAPG